MSWSSRRRKAPRPPCLSVETPLLPSRRGDTADSNGCGLIARRRESPLWVKTGNALIEQMFSASPPKAEVAADIPEVAFVMQCSKQPLFNDFVCTGKERWWHDEAEHPSGLGVDDQFELARLHHRQVDRLRTLENATSVDSDLTQRVR